MGETRKATVTDAPFGLVLSQEPQFVLLLANADSLRLVGAWLPLRQLLSVRAGETNGIPVHVHNPTSATLRGTLRVHCAGRMLGQAAVRLQPREQREVRVPVRIEERSIENLRVTVEWASDPPNVLHTATVWLCVSNALRVRLLPPARQRVMAVVENPAGEALQATLRVQADGERGSAPVHLAKGEREALVQVEMQGEVAADVRMTAQMVDRAGRVLTRSDETRWVLLDAIRPGAASWRAWVDGDAKVEARAQVAITDAPEPTPLGVRAAARLDYHFAKGWRFACVNVPESNMPIEGKPKAVGMWVYGDGSGNFLRCRITDSTGQTFQPNYGPITWKGWRFVTMRLDGGFPGFWGGVKDGVLHYPIRWEAVALVDSNQQSAEKEWSIYITGIALQY